MSGVRNRIKRFISLSKNSIYEKRFINLLSRYKVKWESRKEGIILTQIIEDYEMCLKMAATANYLARKMNSNIGLYTAATQIEEGDYSMFNVKDRITYERIQKRLDNIFLSFAGKVLFRNIYPYDDSAIINDQYRKIKASIITKDDVINITIDNIKVGDLIYDTYLRFGYKSTLDIRDPFLDKVLIDALNVYYTTKKFIASNNIKALVNSYATYIKHGIIARICLENNIPVYTVGAINALVHKAKKEYPSHLNNHFDYRKIFNSLDGKNERIESAKKAFEGRFAGRIDDAVLYMKTSAFSKFHDDSLNNYDWGKTVVLLAHCFFDSPHVYRKMLFADFYEWITFTLDTLVKSPGITVLVKPHPNGKQGNEAIFEKLMERYKNTNIKFITPHVSNTQIIKLKPLAIITAHGTPASEFAYWGIPVISNYDNPFSAYNFSHMARNKDEYREYLQKIDKLSSPDFKDEILEYYYMQHLFFLDGFQHDYLSFVKYKDAPHDDVLLADYVPNMNEEYFQKLDKAINSGFKLIELEMAS